MSKHKKKFDTLSQRIYPLLASLYTPEQVRDLLDRLQPLLKRKLSTSINENLNKWSENNVLIVTYGNSIAKPDERPLVTLRKFLKKYFKDAITGVHILPCFPYSSDDGFSVIDYTQIDSELGDWDDVEKIARRFNLMLDLVLNHISSKSEWFQQFRTGMKPGCDYFIAVDPSIDVSQVVRPRSTPLLVPVETVSGTQYLWTTFSSDQIDVNFANPDVLLEYIKIILLYVEKGARYIRLDAVGFLWKKLGTPCIHLPETHTVIRLLRELLQALDPGIALITETNVPNRENLSYFGNRNEAHMIYNFSLPPLVLNALLQGRSDHLKTWMMSMPPAPIGCAYFNFTASHDGIGLRPAEGLLSEDEFRILLQKMQDFGGKISMRQQPDGSHSPYEINISFFDAMKGTAKGEDAYQIDRFLCSQTIMMSLEGIPAFYIHSLLATPNDYENLAATQRNRSINRHQWNREELEKLLADPTSKQSRVLTEISRRIQIRRKQSAFHPNATQYTLHPLNPALFVFWRQSVLRDQSIFCIFNLSDRIQELLLSDLNLVIVDPWIDLLNDCQITDIYDKYILEPYQCAWITNKF